MTHAARWMGLGLLLGGLGVGGTAHAASVGTGELSFSAHLTGALLDQNPLWGGELALGAGLFPRLRLELVGSAQADFESSREFMVGARPLVRLGGLLGDVELGATAYASYGGTTDDAWGAALGPHLRWTFTWLSAFYEPLFFTHTQFGELDPDALAQGQLRTSQVSWLRLGVGVQF